MDKSIEFIDGARYRTDLTSVNFLLPKKEVDIAALVVTVELMAESSSKYKTERELALKCGDLYGAQPSFNIMTSDDSYIVTASMSTLAGKFRKMSGNLQEKGLKLLAQIVFSDWSHDQKALERIKYTLEKKTADILTDPDFRSGQGLKKNFFPQSSFSELPYGTPQQIRAVDATKIAAVRSLLKKSPRFLLGISSKKKQAEARATKLFGPFGDNFVLKPITTEFETPDDLTEKSEYTQSVVTWAYQVPLVTDVHSYLVARLANYILGASSSSLLFTEVREKHGLCYSISSYAIPHSELLAVKAGIDAVDYKRTLTVVQSVMADAYKSVDSSLLKAAKENMVSLFEQTESTASSKVSFMRAMLIRGLPTDIKVYIDGLADVTPKEVRDYLKQLTKVGSYAVLGTGKGN